MDQIHVSIDGHPYSVIGGEFWDMLECVKSLPGRTYTRKTWTLPLRLDEAREKLAPFQIVGEESLLDAEIEDIQRVQARILELREAIERRVDALDREVSRYSYRSQSCVKAGKAHDRSLLSHALENAALPVERLTEPQVKALYAALRLMEE